MKTQEMSSLALLQIMSKQAHINAREVEVPDPWSPQADLQR